MIRSLFARLLAPRHPWRSVSFSELSEMYIAVLLRTTSVGMIGVFVPIYLLKSGFGVTGVLWYYCLFYAVGIAFDYLVGELIARFGPKHIMCLSFLLQTVFSVMLINIQALPQPILLAALVASLASTMYFMPYYIGFSKIKHPEHGGKEVGFMQGMERIGGVLGPFAGGALATYIHPHATFMVAGVAMLVAAIVLMVSPEPIQTHQRIRYKGLQIKKGLRDYISFMSFAVESCVSNIIWPFYLAAVVFAGTNAYIKIGTVTSISILAATLIVVPLGKLLDRQGGKLMIQFGTAVNALLHLARPFISTFGGSVLLGAVNEPNTSVYRIAYLKGYYDAADDHPGYRIAYITSNEMFGDGARAIMWLVLLAVSCGAGVHVVCGVGFAIAALASMGIRLQQFKALH